MVTALRSEIRVLVDPIYQQVLLAIVVYIYNYVTYLVVNVADEMLPWTMPSDLEWSGW